MISVSICCFYNLGIMQHTVFNSSILTDRDIICRQIQQKSKTYYVVLVQDTVAHATSKCRDKCHDNTVAWQHQYERITEANSLANS